MVRDRHPHRRWLQSQTRVPMRRGDPMRPMPVLCSTVGLLSTRPARPGVRSLRSRFSTRRRCGSSVPHIAIGRTTSWRVEPTSSFESYGSATELRPRAGGLTLRGVQSPPTMSRAVTDERGIVHCRYSSGLPRVPQIAKRETSWSRSDDVGSPASARPKPRREAYIILWPYRPRSIDRDGRLPCGAGAGAPLPRLML